MAQQVPVKNFYGKILGWLETAPNGDVTARAFNQQILGYYRAQRNVTTDFLGRIIGQGNIVATLLPKE